MSVGNSDDDERSTRFEAYADFETVSRAVAKSVDDAVDAYATIQSRHNENARVKPELAAEASSAILGASLKLLPELEADRDDVDEYDELVETWKGPDGRIEQIKRTQLVTDCPAWVGDFVVELRRAGFQLGYLRAGREEDLEDTDWRDGDLSAMFS